MDMFDLFREPDEQKSPNNPPVDSDSPPIQPSSSSNSDSEIYYASESTRITQPASSHYSSTLPPSSKVSMEKTVVLAIPGSLIFRKHSFQIAWLTSLSKSVERLRQDGYAIALVVGESPDVRAAAHAGRQLGISHSEIESATRASSQLHAALVLRTLAQAHPRVCDSVQETIPLLQQRLVPVMLGSKDTLSMEARAAMLAEAISAKFILFTDGDIPFNTITHSRFSRMAGEAAFRSKQEFIVDPLTALILSRAKLETFLVCERNVGNLPALMGGDHSFSTRITSNSQHPVRSIARGEIPPETENATQDESFSGPEPVLPTYSRSIPREENPDDAPPSPDYIVRHLR